MRNCHRCLAIILESFIRNQGIDEPVHGYVRLGNHVQCVRLFMPLVMVSLDGACGDVICGRCKGYNQFMGRISRSCDVNFEDCDDVNHRCNFLRPEEFHKDSMRAMKLMGICSCEDSDVRPVNEAARKRELRELEEKFKAISQHIHDSAFAEVWFGENPCGIFGATPTDLMHAFLHGALSA